MSIIHDENIPKTSVQWISNTYGIIDAKDGLLNKGGKYRQDIVRNWDEITNYLSREYTRQYKLKYPESILHYSTTLTPVM